MATAEVDYVVVGSGLTGCALASRLKQSNPSLDVLILEAGIDPSDNPDTNSFPGLFSLLGSELDWSYPSTPQPNTGNRVHTIHTGKALGGGSVINFGGWSRGDPSDYDEWAKAISNNMGSPPIHVTSVSASDPQRKYPLREPIKAAWTELGVKYNPGGGCSGSSEGISEFLENWCNGQRQPAHLAYSLDNVRVITGAIAHRVEFSQDDIGGKVASAVLLADGRRFAARKEIILSAGTLRTPQLLMLSGIGPVDGLSKYGIPVVFETPDVGKNLMDHFAHYQLFRLRNPQRGLALGSPLLTDPAFTKGFPTDWAVNEAVPWDLLEPALKKHESTSGSTLDDRSLLSPGRSHIETFVVYAPAGVPGVPMDGSYIMTSVMLLLPTSRGSISITSASPTDFPAVNSNYYDTDADRVSLIHGTRRVLQALLDTSAAKDYIESEVPPPGMPPLSAQSPYEDIDARIRATGLAHHHPAGSAAMGRMVGTDLYVYGVRGLRIADASVLPVAIGGHPQATLYAVAEQGAELILQDR